MPKKRKSDPKLQFGNQVPRIVKKAFKLDEQNKNQEWKKAINKEVQQLIEEYSLNKCTNYCLR